MFGRTFALFLMLVAVGASAATLKCGDAQAAVINSTIVSYPYFTIALVSKSFEKFYRFTAENEFLKMRCDKLADGSPVLFVLHSCGGSGCAEETNFGVIDVTSGKILLEPNERWHGNAAQAKKILGKDIVPFSCFTANRALEKSIENGEICFSSGVELG
jgi:hypothetical protein